MQNRLSVDDDVSVLPGLTEKTPRLAVAYSGGLDSSVLLHMAQKFSIKYGFTLCAFHVHHGISRNADDWLAHCDAQCQQLDVQFDAQKITVVKSTKTGIEEAARIARYAALGALCRKHHVSILLTAHHQDDQAETVLLQLLRGSGVAGLSGMDIQNTAPDLLGDASVQMARPLLKASRAGLAAFAVSNGVSFVEDESNSDLRYARNALRHTVMPALAQSFPGFQQRLARTARHAQSAQRLLIVLAEQDLRDCQDGDCLDIRQLKRLSLDRTHNLLRYWFGSRGIRMPSTAWLNEMLVQLLEAKEDAQLCVTHADCHIRRYHNRIFMTPKLDDAGLSVAPVPFRWMGERQIAFPAYSGIMYFDVSELGIDVDWLLNEALTIRLRGGGERMKLALNRPTKSLKSHYQACNVPAWERTRLPVITGCDGTVLFAAGIGMDCHRLHLRDTPGQKISLRWQADDF
ncbi:MAG: tRNA lysidine(34) synthetase TilS [Glaciimonas sp.]|nr:tRNA lysidine(34) synthetase TilS [Glaciimonas sp.]